MDEPCCDCPEHQGETCRDVACKHRAWFDLESPEFRAAMDEWLGPRAKESARAYAGGNADAHRDAMEKWLGVTMDTDLSRAAREASDQLRTVGKPWLDEE